MSFLSPLYTERVQYDFSFRRGNKHIPRNDALLHFGGENSSHLRLNMHSPVMSLSLNPAGTFCCPDFVSL